MHKHRKRKRVAPKTRERSQQLRTNSTFPEQRLWSMLRARQLGGIKFRRQHPIEPYVVDFLCASAKLVIELDGESHDGRRTYDDRRTQHLEDLGFQVLRVTNNDVLTNLDGVMELIARHAGFIKK